MKYLIVLLAAAAVSSAQLVYSPLAAHAPHGLRTQYHAQDELGQYSFGYSGGPSSKVESSHGGVTQGAFSYVDAHGLVQSRNYVADPHGFRVAGTDIPVDSNTPLAVSPLAHTATPVAGVAPIAPLAHTYRVAPLAHHAVAPLALSHVAPLSPLAHSAVILGRKRRQAIFAHSYGAYPYSYGAYPYSTVAYPYHAAPVAAVPHHVAVNPYPQDTPVVAAAKINHNVQYNNEAVRNALGRKRRSVLGYSPLAYSGYSYAYSAPVAHTAYAAPVVAAHTAYAAPVVAAHTAYAAPVVAPVVANPYPQDTHEVADAKLRHTLQYNAEAVRNAHLAHY